MYTAHTTYYIKRKQITLRLRRKATKYADMLIKAMLALAAVLILCVNC